MNKSEVDQTRKEKLLHMLNSLSPTARKAILFAALEEKALRAEVQKLKKQGQEAKDVVLFANNKVFTADKVAEARTRLKAKLDALNRDIDPQID